MAVAIFDLDNTLIAGDSDHAWGEFLVEKQLVDAQRYREKNDYFYSQYQRGALDIKEYLSFALEPLAAIERKTLNALHDEFMRDKIQPLLLPKAASLIQKHHDLGHTSLIITSTNRFVAEPIARKLGIEHFIGSDIEEIHGNFTGQPSGTPAFQQGKISRLHTWLDAHDHSLGGSYGYSDSLNDIPLLEAVEYPVVVDGDEKLIAHATAKGWSCISLRE